MKYDDASWHYGGDFPQDLPPEAGATHIAMFVAWSLLNGLAGSIHTEESPEALEQLQRRELTPGAWFINWCDEKFTDEDLSQEGNAFATAYYVDKGPRSYLADYEATFSDTDNVYPLDDDWGNYDRLAPTVSMRFLEWKSPPPKGWKAWFSKGS